MSNIPTKAVEAAKQDFLSWFLQQPEDIQYELAITRFDANTQMARFRRLFVKTMENNHSKRIKQTPQRASAKLIQNKARVFYRSYAPRSKRAAP